MLQEPHLLGRRSGRDGGDAGVHMGERRRVGHRRLGTAPFGGWSAACGQHPEGQFLCALTSP